MRSQDFIKERKEHHKSLEKQLELMQIKFISLMEKTDFENRLPFYPNNSLDKEDPAYKKLEELREFSENPTFEVSGCGMKSYAIGFTSFINHEVEDRTLSERVYNFITDTPVEELAHSIINYCCDMCGPSNQLAYTTLHDDLGKAQAA